MSKTFRSEDVKDLREDVEKLLSSGNNLLGELSTGENAIWVEPPDCPSVGKGLHCIIERYPKKLSGYLYAWNVNLILYPDNSDVNGETIEKYYENLDSAIRKINNRYPRNTQVILPYQDGMLFQASFGLIFERFAYNNV